jgi:preprotein translocase subunit SecE
MGKLFAEAKEEGQKATWVNGRMYEFLPERKIDLVVGRGGVGFNRMPLQLKGSQHRKESRTSTAAVIIITAVMGAWALSAFLITAKLIFWR